MNTWVHIAYAEMVGIKLCAECALQNTTKHNNIRITGTDIAFTRKLSGSAVTAVHGTVVQ